MTLKPVETSGRFKVTSSVVHHNEPRATEGVKISADHIAGIGFTSMDTLQFGAQVHDNATSDKDSGCKKQQWIRNGRSSGTIPAWQLERVKSKKEVYPKKHKETKESPTLPL